MITLIGIIIGAIVGSRLYKKVGWIDMLLVISLYVWGIITGHYVK